MNRTDLKWIKRRAAEALRGDGAVFDEREDHDRAVLVLMLVNLDGCQPRTADEISAITGFPAMLVARWLARVDRMPLEASEFLSLNLPGPSFEVIRDAQVALGLAYPIRCGSETEFDLSDAARRNIARFLGWGSPEGHTIAVSHSNASPGAVCAGSRLWRPAAVLVEGCLRLRRGSEDVEQVNVGSRFILLPHPTHDANRLPVDGFVRFECDSLTLWFRLERTLTHPRRLELRLVGTASKSGRIDPIDELRSALTGCDKLLSEAPRRVAAGFPRSQNPQPIAVER